MAIRFKDWTRLCDTVARETGRISKSNIIRDWARKPERWNSPDLKKAFKFLIPKYDHRTFNLQDKQLIKILARVYKADATAMESDMQGETGVMADTAEKFFPISNVSPIALTLADVDDLLLQFSLTGTESRQVEIFTGLAKVCSPRDMNYVVRLLKKDLRLQGQDRTVLDGLHEDAYDAFKQSKDIEALVEKVVSRSLAPSGGGGAAAAAASKPSFSKRLSSSMKMGTPIEPMLAKQLKDLNDPFSKGFKTGKEVWGDVAVEIKYDGERVQVHMNDGKFSYFSRSLKESQPKVTSEIKDHVPAAFSPETANCIIDAEVLLVDRTKSGHAAMLPFGSLGVHKKTAFGSANVCLYVFDILWLNGESLLGKPLRERRKILEETIVPIQYRVRLSEFKWIKEMEEAQEMMETVTEHGLEGIMLKNGDGMYNPKGRHWLKVKRNYLKDEKGNSMVDSLDLVVLGGYYGTGKKAKLLSSFLMGCQDTTSGRWKTVTKVANGFDDAQLEKINKKIKPLLIPWDTANAHKWLTVDASLVPPFVIDPSNAPVWEIGGAEFTESTKHSAVVAIRFPVITKERPDKDAAHANTLEDVVHIRDVSLARASLTSSGGGAAAAAKAPKKRAAPSILTALGASASKREKVDVKLSGDTMCIDDDDDDDGEDEWKPASIDAPRGTAASAAPSADSRDFCKYGKGCYRKNPDHIKLFRHGDDRDAL